MFEFPLAAYLARIDWTGPVDVSPAMLVALHRHHALAIPFENIDPFSGRPVSLEPGDLVEKMIHRRRGGYCFEQNGLFLLALHAIGFHTRSLCARVLISEGNYGPRSHQITLVEFETSRWLADVGFGGNGLIEAIPFELHREFDQKLDLYRLVEDPTFGYRLEHRLPTDWRTLYAFSLDPYLFSDYRALNYFICRSPDSIFTNLPICVRSSEIDRRLIVANQLKIRAVNGASTTAPLKDSSQLRTALAGHLGIALPYDFTLPDPPPPPPGMREI